MEQCITLLLAAVHFPSMKYARTTRQSSLCYNSVNQCRFLVKNVPHTLYSLASHLVTS